MRFHLASLRLQCKKTKQVDVRYYYRCICIQLPQIQHCGGQTLHHKPNNLCNSRLYIYICVCVCVYTRRFCRSLHPISKIHVYYYENEEMNRRIRSSFLKWRVQYTIVCASVVLRMRRRQDRN